MHKPQLPTTHLSGADHSPVATRRESLQRMACWAGAALAGSPAWAKTAPASASPAYTWPKKPVQLTVPYPAGGMVARLGQAAAKALEPHTPHAITTQYVLGKAGRVAGEQVAKATADGSQLLLAGSHMAIAHAMRLNAPFDFLSHLQPVMLLAQMPMVVITNPGRLRARTASELVMELGRKPARYRVSCGGTASTSRMGAEMLRFHTKSQLEVVNFRGAGPALQALVAGHTDVMVEALVSCLPEIRSGRVRPLMVLAPLRHPTLPHVETSTEVDLSALQMDAWCGVFGPQGMSAALTQQVQQRLGTLVQDAHFASDWGIAWSGLLGGAFEAFLRERVDMWTRRVHQLGLPTGSVAAQQTKMEQ